MSEQIINSKNFPPIVGQMLTVGERDGPDGYNIVKAGRFL